MLRIHIYETATDIYSSRARSLNAMMWDCLYEGNINESIDLIEKAIYQLETAHNLEHLDILRDDIYGCIVELEVHCNKMYMELRESLDDSYNTMYERLVS